MSKPETVTIYTAKAYWIEKSSSRRLLCFDDVIDVAQHVM